MANRKQNDRYPWNGASEAKNTVQALKYPSAHAVTLYMPGFKAINWK